MKKFIRLIQTLIISVALFFAAVVVFNSNSLLAIASVPATSNSPDKEVPTAKGLSDILGFQKHGLPSANKSNSPTGATTNSDNIVINGKITKGDSFDYSLRLNNVPGSVRHQIISSLNSHLDFRRLDTNDKYTVILNKDKSLVSCFFYAGPLESYSLVVDDSKIKVTKSTVHLESRKVKISGEIKNSLFLTFANINESPKLVYAFADIFASRIDFNTETQPGDRFILLVDKYYKDGEFIGYGKINSGEYSRINGQKLTGFYYSTKDIAGTYFDQHGQEVGTSFIRSPVPMSRVTSKFSYRRKHPITGRIQPHLGIDLAAPLGTPILAASDGKIKFIGRNRGNGRQIIIKHSAGYQTYYGHLARYKKGLRKGSIVSKKDIIGYVGSSGLSTGPHLDYRIRHNGVFKNPYSLEFAPKSELKGQLLADFHDEVDEISKTLNLPSDFSQTIIQVENITLSPENKLTLL